MLTSSFGDRWVKTRNDINLWSTIHSERERWRRLVRKKYKARVAGKELSTMKLHELFNQSKIISVVSRCDISYKRGFILHSFLAFTQRHKLIFTFHSSDIFNSSLQLKTIKVISSLANIESIWRYNRAHTFHQFKKERTSQHRILRNETVFIYFVVYFFRVHQFITSHFE